MNYKKSFPLRKYENFFKIVEQESSISENIRNFFPSEFFIYFFRLDWEMRQAALNNTTTALEEIEFKRCIKAVFLLNSSHFLYSFSDASVLGYGESSYLRLVDKY